MDSMNSLLLLLLIAVLGAMFGIWWFLPPNVLRYISARMEARAAGLDALKQTEASTMKVARARFGIPVRQLEQERSNTELRLKVTK